MTLEFWREYRSFSHLGDDWGIHESIVHRTVERVETALSASQQFRLPGQKDLAGTTTVYSMMLVDVAEVPCERPKKTAGMV